MRAWNPGSVALLAALALGPCSALAAPFACPHIGGALSYGEAAGFNGLDPMTTGSAVTRDITLNIFETLVTRDENLNPILDLAQAMTESPDHLTYTFRLRQGVHFHNGKAMSAADVVASFDRYARVGRGRAMLANVAGWDAADPDTFVIHMKQVQPTFLRALSGFIAPIVIIPAEARDDPPQQLRTIGTGPFELAHAAPGSVTLRRFPGYTPNAGFDARSGLGGYKQACLDTVTFRIMPDPAERLAALRSGALQVADAVPADALAELQADRQVNVLPLPDWSMPLAYPNAAVAPTNDLMFRKAVQATLDMDEIMQAAAHGTYTLQAGLLFPHAADRSDAGHATYNLHDPALAKRYLGQSGYQGEPVVLLTNNDEPALYNAALVVQQELQAVGINAQLKVTDAPTSAQLAQHADSGWNLFFTAWGAGPALGPLAVMRAFVPPEAVYQSLDAAPDPELARLWDDINRQPTPEGRQRGFAAMQQYVLEQVYALPFGSMPAAQAVRTNVAGFAPFRVLRLANVWLQQ
jgi:peptide/nickel transport system substrate-binding protein